MQPLDGRLACHRFVTVEGVAYGEDNGLGFCGGNVLGSVTGETATGSSVRSNPVKCLGHIKCFNVS